MVQCSWHHFLLKATLTLLAELTMFWNIIMIIVEKIKHNDNKSNDSNDFLMWQSKCQDSH